MIRGRIFSEMIRIQARKSELQAQNYSRRAPRIRVESPRKDPRIGFRCFYGQPPLKPSWIHLKRVGHRKTAEEHPEHPKNSCFDCFGCFSAVYRHLAWDPLGTFFSPTGTTPITILAVNPDHGLSFAGEETRTMV